MAQNSEHLEQVSAVNWFEATYPGVFIFAIPNGGERHPAVAEKMRREGARRGVPDLMIPRWRTFVEMKAIKGRLSEQQKDRIAYLSGVGYRCLVCYGFEDFKEQISRLFPTNDIDTAQPAS